MEAIFEDLFIFSFFGLGIGVGTGLFLARLREASRRRASFNPDEPTALLGSAASHLRAARSRVSNLTDKTSTTYRERPRRESSIDALRE